MNIAEAKGILDGLIAAGKGTWPFQLMEVREGVTYAMDIEIAAANPYDGERVWLFTTEEHAPEWMA